VVIKKKPVRELPAGYVPPNSDPFPVSGSTPEWNWASVAAHHKLPDVWADLILFNFPTVAYETSFQNRCAAVNWLLEERVGCVNSKDGVNYSFVGATKGVIYVPKVVTNDVGRRAAKSVMNVLGSPHLHSLNFVFDDPHSDNDIVVYPTFFHKVAAAILDGKIGIAVNPAELEAGAEAQYDHTASPPMFYLRFADASSALQKSAIIHEAAHAVSHLKGRDRDIVTDESAAYLAQAVFYRKLTGSRINHGGEKVKAIYQAADDAAQVLARGKLIGESECLPIMQAVAKVYDLGTYHYSAFPVPK
jgi:hypothetical protein